MKSEISIKHSTYMMTIKEVIEAIESAANVKIIKISVTDDVLTFHVEELVPEDVIEQYDPDIHGYPDEIYEERERKQLDDDY